MKQLILALTLLAALPGMAQQTENSCKQKEWKPQTFLEADELPDETYFLPAPPKESSIAFTADVLRYQWGKMQRDTERGAQAVKDANWTTIYMLEYFAPALGCTLSEEETPETYNLLKQGIGAGGNSVKKGKKKYHRTRPYAFFNESTSIPGEEEDLRHNGSYPSGHTARGWMVALILVELFPQHQNEILKAGYEYGESRVIVGFHYQSDVNAARIASSAAFARLHADEGFQKQLAKAKKELKKKGLAE